MRKLVYDCVENGHVVKTVTSYRDAINWGEREGCEFNARLEEFELTEETKKQEKKEIEGLRDLRASVDVRF